jgi:hypothetical protein
MARYSPGDKIFCYVKDNKIVNIYEDKWHEKRIFDIISSYDEGYIVHVPASFYLEDSFEITNSNYKKYNVLKKFINSNAYYINEFKIAGTYSRLDGLCCVKCKDFYAMAEANQPNGELVCWNCRTYPFFK